MHRRLSFVALAGAAALVAGVLGPARAASPAFTKFTDQVPVSQPDNEGRSVTLDTDIYVPTGTAPAQGWPIVEVFHGGVSNGPSTLGLEAASSACSRRATLDTSSPPMSMRARSRSESSTPRSTDLRTSTSPTEASSSPSRASCST